MIEFKSPSLSFSESRVFVSVLSKKRVSAPSVSWFVGNHLLFKSWNISDYSSLQVSHKRTSIISDETHFLATPEHLSPVFLLWHHLSFEVKVLETFPEVPLLDGSSFEFVKALRKGLPFAPELLFYDISESFRMEFPYGFCEVSPSDTFEVEYSLKQENFEDNIFVSIYTPEDLYAILKARTFIFENQFNKLREQGMLSGVQENSGLLLRPMGKSLVKVLQGSDLRFSQEILCHKVLDLVGDFSLFVQELPRARIRIHNGGHAIHHQIFQRLVKYVHSRYPSKV